MLFRSLHVDDCVAGLLFAFDLEPDGVAPEIWNLAPADATSVKTIAELCVARSPHPNARIRYTGGSRGWRGDVPFCRMNPDRLAARGFRVRLTSDEAVWKDAKPRERYATLQKALLQARHDPEFQAYLAKNEMQDLSIGKPGEDFESAFAADMAALRKLKP